MDYFNSMLCLDNPNSIVLAGNQGDFFENFSMFVIGIQKCDESFTNTDCASEREIEQYLKDLDLVIAYTTSIYNAEIYD